jgi:hypothetical protein
MEKEFVVYGKKKFNPEKFRKIKNRKGWCKPKAGLWASPIDSKWGWRDFIISVMESWKKDLQTYFKFKLSSTAKIYIIDTLEDLYQVPFKRILKLRPALSDYLIDFEKMVSEGYDGILLTENGQNETRMPEFSGLYYNGKSFNLYGWDVECLLVLNPRCIVPVNSLKRINLKNGRNAWKKNVVIARTQKSISQDDPEILEWKGETEDTMILERGSTYGSKKAFIRSLRKLQYKIGDDPTSKFILK